MTSDERAWLGRKWLEAGLGEHASVAAFACFVLDLMQLGAPPDLILGAVHAMEDEVEHARLCFGVARQFNNGPASPGPMLLPQRSEHREPAAILESAIFEGCFEEVVSAECARVARDRADASYIRNVMERIAADEARHADLSWRAVEWILKCHPELRETAVATFAAKLQACCTDNETSPSAIDEDDSTMPEGYGHLRGASQQRVREMTLDEVIRPRARMLLGAAVDSIAV
jgi:hypothetical protein